MDRLEITVRLAAAMVTNVKNASDIKNLVFVAEAIADEILESNKKYYKNLTPKPREWSPTPELSMDKL